MLRLRITSSFKRDLKRMKKHGYDLELLENIIDLLLKGKRLPVAYKDHALIGNYQGFRECHISPDWLLIYSVDRDDLILTALRTGTHSDLFKKRTA